MNDVSTLNRKLKERVEFKKDGDFQSLYSAQEYLNKNGFVYGSLCGDLPVAIVKGKDFSDYKLPEKWKNFSDKEKNQVDGIIKSNDFRNGIVVVLIFEQFS